MAIIYCVVGVAILIFGQLDLVDIVTLTLLFWCLYIY